MSYGHGDLKFSWGLSKSDPELSSVLFVGQTSHLSSLKWDEVKQKLEPRVTEEAWRRAVHCSQTCPGDMIEMWPRGAALASLGAARVSRHNTPARTNLLAKVLRSASTAKFIVLVCRKRDVYASVACVARSFPLFSARTAKASLEGTSGAPGAPAGDAGGPRARNLTVEILLADCQDDEPEPLGSVLAERSLADEELRCLSALADGTRLAARLTDTPANMMNVDQFIQEAFTVAKSLKIPDPTVIRGSELAARGFGGLAGVGAAAASPPALLVLSYRAPQAADTVAWVGKGIVYDTGGLSLKARTSMVGMKGDCGGAAAVLGAFAAAVRAEPVFNLHAVLCLAENAVGPKATRPDDIHKLYSGRTVEINNTDAEGRLVLSDGVVYASRDLKADTIVDVATLTGAQGTATGKYHAAVLSNSAALEARCVAAGRAAGDLAHALPFAPDLHFQEFTSEVADMKNSVADRNNAQPSCAGLFILAHLGFDWPGNWLHVDMAGPSVCGERATGYGVALLTVLFGHHTKSRLLQALSPGPVTSLEER